MVLGDVYKRQAQRQTHGAQCKEACNGGQAGSGDGGHGLAAVSYTHLARGAAHRLHSKRRVLHKPWQKFLHDLTRAKNAQFHNALPYPCLLYTSRCV